MHSGLVRLLKIDTLIAYDPWSRCKENPDHCITAKAVKAARWMAGISTHYPEQLKVVQPHTVKEMYYFARGPQIGNRIVDIGKFIDKKVESIIACKTQGAFQDVITFQPNHWYYRQIMLNARNIIRYLNKKIKLTPTKKENVFIYFYAY